MRTNAKEASQNVSLNLGIFPVTRPIKGAGKTANVTSIRKMLPWALVIVVVSAALASSSVVAPQRVSPVQHSFSWAEEALRREPVHISEFGPASAPLALPKCENVRPPEALLTPDPLLPTEKQSLLVRISFIVGSDGRVYSALVLNSGGADEDRLVLRTVRQWRYRPALCNGVPTDIEARVRFSIQ